MKKQQWQVVIQPTKDGRGFQMDSYAADVKAQASVALLVEKIGEILGQSVEVAR